MVDLDLDVEVDEVEPTRHIQRWTAAEEKVLSECWVEVSENNEIRSDRFDDLFWAVDSEIPGRKKGRNSNERITTMENMFTAKLGTIKTKLTRTTTSSISATIEKHHEVWMKMLSLERYFEAQDIERGEQLRAAVLCMEG
nr:hypothetical protein [Tanacetum cinerariifolium]